jgi:hypothetical protein
MDEREKGFYRTPGPLTDLSSCPSDVLEGLPDTPADLMGVVRGCVIDPATLTQIYLLDVPSGRDDERQIRRAVDMVAKIIELDDAPLAEARPPGRRFFGTCRNYATLTAALFRWAGIATRVRAGFAGYFVPGTWMDHWIVEYERDGAWVRVDTELDDTWLAKRAPGMTSEILAGTMFLSGSEAWRRCRSDELDPDHFEMGGNRGIGEIRGSVLYDLAALNQNEMLPWDCWARMEDAYKHETDERYDAMLDHVADVTIRGDLDEIKTLYRSNEDLNVPASMLPT